MMTSSGGGCCWRLSAYCVEATRDVMPPYPLPRALRDFEAYRKILHEAIACPEYVDYDAMPDYAQGIEEAIYPLGDLMNAGHAAVVIELAEFALIELDKAKRNGGRRRWLTESRL